MNRRVEAAAERLFWPLVIGLAVTAALLYPWRSSAQGPPSDLELRRTKGSALTHNELDDTLENLYHILTGASSAAATVNPFSFFIPSESGGLTATDCDAAGEARQIRIDEDEWPSGDWLCGCDGTAWRCIGSGSAGAGFDAITTGTNTTAAMVVGAGATLKKESTGTIDASAVDSDGDGNREVTADGTYTYLDHNDDGTADTRISGIGQTRTIEVWTGSAWSAAVGRWNSGGVILLQVAASNNLSGLSGLAPTATLPSVFPVSGDINTGMGYAGTDDVRIIAGGASGLGVTTTEIDLYVIVDHGTQAVTCTDSGDASPGALSLAPTTSYVAITNSDADGCVVTLSETGAAEGRIFEARVVSTAGGTVDWTNSAGVQEVPSSLVLGCQANLYGFSEWRYIADRWVLRICETY